MQSIDIQDIPLPPAILVSLEKGETITLRDASGALAFIVAAHPLGSKRPFGLAKGEFTVPPDFNDPLPDLEDAIYGP
jgi:antitoxin (DNA-binding transcriptional repressor) of toxin-antitoxin stability system